ncbi:MAG: SPFH domain-containing protein [Clostridiales bacterium]|nr:SPFH domain-containing protein [Clostridiales bacterium]
MGLFTGQLLKVIEWSDATQDTMVYKFPMPEKAEIMMGSQLIVRESQVCIFLSSGKMADVFPPGRYKLDTGNMPLLTKLMSWKYGFNSPFKCDVYYVNTKQFINQKWGTANPIMMRDQDFGMVRFRAFGTYSFQVDDAAKFFREVAGTLPSYKIASLSDQLKSILISGIGEAVAASSIPALDLSMQLSRLTRDTNGLILERFSGMGIKLSSMAIENISLPEEVEKAMDKRTSMGALGDVNRYTAFQAADSMRDIAANAHKTQGGMMNNIPAMGMGLGTGFAMTNMYAGGIQQSVDQGKAAAAQQSAQAQQQAAPKQNTVKCAVCGEENPAAAKFCCNCGGKMAQSAFCPECGAKVTAGAKFCPECGKKI